MYGRMYHMFTIKFYVRIVLGFPGSACQMVNLVLLLWVGTRTVCSFALYVLVWGLDRVSSPLEEDRNLV